MLKFTVTTETLGRAWEGMAARIKLFRTWGSIGKFRAAGQPRLKFGPGSRQSDDPPVRRPSPGRLRIAGARGGGAHPDRPALPGSNLLHQPRNRRWAG